MPISFDAKTAEALRLLQETLDRVDLTVPLYCDLVVKENGIRLRISPSPSDPTMLSVIVEGADPAVFEPLQGALTTRYSAILLWMRRTDDTGPWRRFISTGKPNNSIRVPQIRPGNGEYSLTLIHAETGRAVV